MANGWPSRALQNVQSPQSQSYSLGQHAKLPPSFGTSRIVLGHVVLIGVEAYAVLPIWKPYIHVGLDRPLSVNIGDLAAVLALLRTIAL